MIPYEKFEAWRVSALEVYRLTQTWPQSERFELTKQTRCAALSVPCNIAEGAAKRGPMEFRRFLDIARGSLSELSYLLRFSRDLGFLSEDEFQTIDALRDHAGILTWKLYRCMKRKAQH